MYPFHPPSTAITSCTDSDSAKSLDKTILQGSILSRSARIQERARTCGLHSAFLQFTCLPSLLREHSACQDPSKMWTVHCLRKGAMSKDSTRSPMTAGVSAGVVVLDARLHFCSTRARRTD